MGKKGLPGCCSQEHVIALKSMLFKLLCILMFCQTHTNEWRNFRVDGCVREPWKYGSLDHSLTSNEPLYLAFKMCPQAAICGYKSEKNISFVSNAIQM